MKGAVFIAFNEMIESTASMDVWEQMLQRVQPESGGVYTSIESYPDEELFALVNELSTITGLPANTLIATFGESLFNFLNSKYPQFSQQQTNFFDFIKSIDGTIHKEVEKLYSNPNLPTIACKQLNDKTLVMRYSSPRKLCVLAQGLIAGAAAHYKVDCNIEHKECMHKGADECLMHLNIT